MATAKLVGSRGVLIDEALAAKYLFPIKIVFVLEQGKSTIVTAYPLKRGVAK